MKSLFINTSNKQLIVSIIIDDSIKYIHSEENSNQLSSAIMPIIDEAFVKTGLKPNDIDTIFVTNGPGSFTGIRIGLTIAKVMAWSLKIKVIPISTLELMASGEKGLVAPLIDARRGYVFAGLYDEDLNQIIPDGHILLSEFEKKLSEYNAFFVSHDTFEFDTSVPKYDIVKIIKKNNNDEGVNPHTLNPNYLKLTEAEENLNKK